MRDVSRIILEGLTEKGREGVGNLWERENVAEMKR